MLFLSSCRRKEELVNVEDFVLTTAMSLSQQV
jgi:hypothetical protein